MLSLRWILFLAWPMSLQPAAAEPDPLFLQHDVIDVRIVAPLETLRRERPDEAELPATFQYTTPTESNAFDIAIRARGQFRRNPDICDFPPMRLNFQKSQTDGTLFDKQDKVKLVTHCNRGVRYEEVLLREYIAYRIFNELIDTSFRVRLLRITWEDSDGRFAEGTHYGFLIEDRDRLAKRTGGEIPTVERTSIENLDASFLNLTSVYHYMIGNTDFSPISGSKENDCCHNHILIEMPDAPWYSVPYDFDQSGLVDAPHAGPNERFRLSSVRQRLYRGRCENNDRLHATITHFISRRPAIEAVISENAQVSDGSKKKMLKYLARFYDTIESDKKLDRELVRKCI